MKNFIHLNLYRFKCITFSFTKLKVMHLNQYRFIYIYLNLIKSSKIKETLNSQCIENVAMQDVL